jgi:hypothetical protein
MNRRNFKKQFVYLLILIVNSLHIHALIEQQPIFTSQPVDIGPLFSGTRGILQCTASGTSPIYYRWLKDGAYITNRTTNGGVYLISQADRYRDVGKYQCEAENSLGSVLSNTAHLTIAYMDQLKVHYKTEIRVRLGHAAIIKLPNMFDAYPQPTIEWFAGGALIEPNAKFAITKDFHLVVLKCDKADEKAYYVEASSIHTGTRIRSREIRLYVIDSYNSMYNSYENDLLDDEFNLGSANSGLQSSSSEQDSASIDLEFVVKPSDTIAKLNDNLVKFDCIVNTRKQALDQIEIQWFKDDQLIDFIKTKYHLSSRSLEIISVTDQDAGVYTCSAKSNLRSNDMFPSASMYQPNQILNASARLDVHIKPTFKTQPESIIETDYGKSVHIKCEGISNPKANITWFRNAQLINFNVHTNMELQDNKLLINNIEKKDQAIYQCFLSNEAGQISASTLLKIISYAPKFAQAVLNRTVYSDTNIALSCGQVDASPKPKITWIKLSSSYQFDPSDQVQVHGISSDHLLSSTRNALFFDTNPNDYLANSAKMNAQFLNSNDEGELVVKHVNSEHQGWYRCEASNLLGTVSANMYLQVRKKTEIIEPPMNISVTKGQSALLKCTISKEEDIEVDLKWKFNDVSLDLTPIQSSSFDSPVTFENANLRLYANGSLQIIEAKNTDIGVYKCIVKSMNNPEAGHDSKAAYLNVVELPYSPINLYVHLNKFQKRSVNLTWQASFDGNSPIIKYVIHARILSFDLHNANYNQNELTNSIYDVSTNRFSNGNFQQAPNHDWFVVKDNLYEPYNRYHQVDQQQQQQWHSSVIGDLKPAFTYEFRVSAVNGIGEGMPSKSSNNITIPEEVPSEAPLNVQANALSPNTINVQWQPPVFTSWNGRLKGYQVAYSLSYPNSTWKYLKIDDNSQLNANLTDLIVWEIYSIKVCAFNSKGFGKYSEPSIRVRTKEGIPIRAPLNFLANPINSTCISMSWSEPPAQFVNGIIQGYKLLFYENDKSSDKQTHVINMNSLDETNSNAQQNQYSYTMCQLSKYTMYTMSILCFTNSGDGPSTQPIQLKTLEDVPGEVSDIQFINVYDTSIELEWKPPSQPNGLITSYIISFKSNRTNKFENIILDASQTNFTLRNLRSSTDYIIGVRAKTRAGEGVQKLTQIKSGVPPELPEPPKAIVLRTIGHSSCELEFIPGYAGKTSINKWIVEALVILNNQIIHESLTNELVYKWKRVYEKPNAPNATKLTVENLLPFTNYSLRILAQNIKGVSKPSKPTEIFQTLADVPSRAPVYLTARLDNLYKNTTLDNDINALIKWSPIPSNQWNGIPYGYILMLNECDSNWTKRVEIKYNKLAPTSYLMNQLHSYRCYAVKLAAWNNVGMGPWTEVFYINRTTQSRPSRGPKSINLYSINSTSMLVSWSSLLNDAFLNGKLVGYRLRYRAVDLVNITFTKTIYFSSNSEKDQDNDLNYMNSLKSKEIFVKLSSKKCCEYTLTNLLSYTNYRVEVAGCTRAGCGQFSQPYSLRTAESLPSEPFDLKFTYVNMTSFTLEWKAPRYPNGALKSYRIRYILKRYMADSWSSLPLQQQQKWSYIYVKLNESNINNAVYQLTIDDLTKMEYYLVEISANNTIGWGEPASQLIYTTDRRSRPDAPSKPTVSKSSIKSNELTLSWSTNSDNYSPIRYFTIQIFELKYEERLNLNDFINGNQTLPPQTLKMSTLDYNMNELNWRSIYTFKSNYEEQQTNYQVTIRSKDMMGNQLIKQNGREYKFRIAATNDIGTSEFSAESELVKSKYDRPRVSNLHKFQLSLPPNNIDAYEFEWYEQIDLVDLNQNDYLNKFKIVYKQLMQNMQPTEDVLNQRVREQTHVKSSLRDESDEGEEDTTPIEITIEYRNTSKVLINASNYHQLLGDDAELALSDEVKRRIGLNELNFIKHSIRLDSLYNLNDLNSVVEFQLCPINAIGESFKCLAGHMKNTTNQLIYMSDRLPELSGNLIRSVEAISSTELNVTWSRAEIMPHLCKLNGQLIAYKLVYFKTEHLSEMTDLNNLYPSDDSSEFVDVLIVQPNLNNIIVNNLKPFKNYSFVLQLINQAGQSALGSNHLNLNNLTTAQTLESLPNKPSRIVFSYISYTYLNMTWFKPVDANGLILAYELWYENLVKDQSASTAAQSSIKIIRQEIQTSKLQANANNYTLFISNLEASNEYTFKIRCRTRIGWGPYLESIVRTGPQTAELVRSSSVITGLARAAPLAPSKPMFQNLNDTHFLLEWKAYSKDYEMFIMEIKFISFNKNVTSNFEQFAFTNKSQMIVDKYDKRLQSRQLTLCIFRVFTFNAISISEPSPNSDLIHIYKSSTDVVSNASFFNQQSELFYSNWWFLVIIALSSVTVLIIIILIMLIRGKNKKFINNKKRMNTIRMMKLNPNMTNNAGLSETDGPAIIAPINDSPSDSSDLLNQGSVYLGSNAQLILTNTTNSLNRNNLYELRRSKRNPNATTGTIRTATYVSPNGTLSRVNIIDPTNATMASSLDLELKQQLQQQIHQQQMQQHQHIAQPNDYFTSGPAIGSILNQNHYLIPCNTTSSNLYIHKGGASAANASVAGGTVNQNYSSSDTDESSSTNLIKSQTNTFGRPSGSNGSVLTSTMNRNNAQYQQSPAVPVSQLPPIGANALSVNYQMSTFDDRRNANSYASMSAKKVNMNMYYEHQQVSTLNPRTVVYEQRVQPQFPQQAMSLTNQSHQQTPSQLATSALQQPQQHQQQHQHQQPTYHTHQSPMVMKTRGISPKPVPPVPPPPPPPPPPPHSSMPQTSHLNGNIYHQYSKNSDIRTAATHTAEAINALANVTLAATSNHNTNHSSSVNYIGNSSIKPTQPIGNKQLPLSLPQQSNPHQQQSDVDMNESANTSQNANNTSSISTMLNGDRIVMTNIAGSRKPLTGYTSFI